jgi:hypothetical protein
MRVRKETEKRPCAEAKRELEVADFSQGRRYNSVQLRQETPSETSGDQDFLRFGSGLGKFWRWPNISS